MVGVAVRKHRYCCCGGMPAFFLHIALHSTALLLAVIGLALGASAGRWVAPGALCLVLLIGVIAIDVWVSFVLPEPKLSRGRRCCAQAGVGSACGALTCWVGLALIVGVLCALLDGSRAIAAFPASCTEVGGFATNCCRYAEPDAEFGTSLCGGGPLLLDGASVDGALDAAAGWAASAHCRIVLRSGGFVHATCGAASFGFLDFIDDVYVYAACNSSAAAVQLEAQSVSRLGRFDFGVNEARLESFAEGVRERVEGDGLAAC